MGMDVVPFADEHFAAAAALLAARHRGDRAREPHLPAAGEDAAMAAAALARVWSGEGVGGVAALRDGAMVGYLLGAPDLLHPTDWLSPFTRPRSADIPYAAHAVASDHGEALTRRLYAVLAARWAAAGLFAHYVAVPAADRAALDTWFGLGFGQVMTLAVRETGPAATGTGVAGVEFRLATPVDGPALVPLLNDLYASFAEAPTFVPQPLETLPNLERAHAERLDDPTGTCWVATRDGRIVAAHVFIAPESPGWFLSPLVHPERCVYLQDAATLREEQGRGVGSALLARSLAWAREAGHARMALHYMAASRAAEFWRGHGFRPIEHRLCRPVDERVAWGRAGS